MESTFSSPAEAALEREAGAAGLLTPLADLDRVYELQRVVAFVRDLACQRVALQFPDQLLGDAGVVAARLEESTGAKMFILGDTAYGRGPGHSPSPTVRGPACLQPGSSPARGLPQFGAWTPGAFRASLPPGPGKVSGRVRCLLCGRLWGQL
uniref:Diphthamide biosynthesis 2 n=1 Tax=Pipistrellus kuhlii TaxID=59472 RepID=A0A7J8A5W5_PIPKU|nr:diphthamide biosynthesis 2 [Pipistrellus kuhlii]